MNKGKNKGKIQKSRQNAEGREAGSFLRKAFVPTINFFPTRS